MNDFSYKMFDLSSAKAKNLSFSPISMNLLILLLIEGSKRKLQKEFTKLVTPKYNNSEAALSLLNEINKSFFTGELNIRNSISHSALLKVKAEFLSSFPEELRPKIVEFIQTHLEVQFIIKNQISIKAKWLERFKEINSRSDIFYLENGQISESYFMHQSNNDRRNEIKYLKHESFHAIRIPFKNPNLCFEILLPYKHSELGKIIKFLIPENILELNNQYKEIDKIEVIIPQFNFKNSISLKEFSHSLGIKNLFEPTFDFEKLFEAPNFLFLLDIEQVNSIEIDLDGVETKTETIAYGGIGGISDGPSNYVHFEANHPFIFIIRESSTNTILQIGQLKEPNNVSLKDKFLHDEKEKSKKMKFEKVRKIKPYILNTSVRELIYFGLECLNLLVGKNGNKPLLLKIWIEDLVRLISEELPINDDEIKKLNFWNDKHFTGLPYNSKYLSEKDFDAIQCNYPGIHMTLESICSLINNLIAPEENYFFNSGLIMNFENFLSELISNEVELPDMTRFRNNNINNLKSRIGDPIKVNYSLIDNLIEK